VKKLVLLLVVGLFLAGTAWSQTPDTVLVNGKILTVDERFSIQQALAISDGKIIAIGNTADVGKLAGPRSRMIDLQGRTVIPGLIDSHLHGIRAALSFGTEVNWIGASSVVEAVGRIRDAARTMKPGAWLIVAGGWNVQQFRERRRPTQAELIEAAPDNPVYVQLGYGWAMLTPLAWKTLNITAETDLPRNGKFETDAEGKRTGAITGPQEAIIAMFDKLPKPTFDQQVEGTKKFFRELNRLGLTGFVDPGGNNLFFPDYQAVLKVWREGAMTVRVAYSLNGQTDGSEFEELKDLTQLLPMGFGDDMLRFNGIGERITWAMNNNDKPTDAEKAKYYEIIKWAAERGMTLTMHWPRDASVNELLTLFEKLNGEVPITSLRWSIAHLSDASETSLARMKALGMGWTVQGTPPVEMGRRMEVPIGAGTDAHRVASYNPFTELQRSLRATREPPGRADALRFYTIGSAWFSRDEKKRGSLEVGKYADLAVLSKDFMTIPLDEIGSIESVLTMVGGKVVYATVPYQ
jgi:predicted amidohydrolase YtcJ